MNVYMGSEEEFESTQASNYNEGDLLLVQSNESNDSRLFTVVKSSSGSNKFVRLTQFYTSVNITTDGWTQSGTLKHWYKTIEVQGVRTGDHPLYRFEYNKIRQNAASIATEQLKSYDRILDITASNDIITVFMESKPEHDFSIHLWV